MESIPGFFWIIQHSCSVSFGLGVFSGLGETRGAYRARCFGAVKGAGQPLSLWWFVAVVHFWKPGWTSLDSAPAWACRGGQMRVPCGCAIWSPSSTVLYRSKVPWRRRHSGLWGRVCARGGLRLHGDGSCGVTRAVGGLARRFKQDCVGKSDPAEVTKVCKP